MIPRNEILDWLQETDPDRLAELWRRADQTRQEHVGGDVHLRGLIELSNFCVRLCGYCGLRAGNRSLRRYRMSDEEILECVRSAVAFGYGTVVLQSGEDPELTLDRIAGLVRRIKSESSPAVTLSLGERSDEELAAWREAGADRYLLRFETSNRALYDRIHPLRIKEEQWGRHSCLPENGTPNGGGSTTATPTTSSRQECLPYYRECLPYCQESLPQHDRLTILATLRRLGYEVGSGVMIGIPGQTYEDLADDIELFGRLDLDMIGVGPYLRHPGTPLGDPARLEAPAERQVPADETMTYKVIALARLMCPRANIPATTALATLNLREGRELGLVRGANVVMPNLTPQKYRALYEIYPDKACITETGEACHHCLTARIEKLGRFPGRGRGNSANFESRRRGIGK
jgi:biotin synthase